MYLKSLTVKKEILIHLLFWLVWMYYSVVVIDSSGLSVWRPKLFYSTGMLIYILVFYVNYFLVLPVVFKPFRWKKAIAGFVFLFLLFTGLRFLIEEVITVYFLNVRNYDAGTPILYYFYDNLFYSSKPIVLSTVLWSMIYLIRTLEYNRYILEENKNTEIKFLKAQINPHFVFNTLNNIYSMVYFQSDKSLPAIEKLSQIMRFTTYDAQRDKIRLAEEVNYIRAYIELEQLRHEENEFVRMDVDVADPDMEIPPYILSPLVENALKHGVASNEVPVKITLRSDGQQLTFNVENAIGTQLKDKLGGIGLDNLQRRLDIHYPGQHVLQLTTDQHIFNAQIQINLK